MNPEEKTEIMLCEWMNKNQIQTWYNRKISKIENNNFFTTKGKSRKKPDLIIKSGQIGYVAIEVKNCKENRNIYDANKIINYQKEYKEGLIKYYINNQEICIAAFIVASDESMNGKLFIEEEKVFPEGEWQKICLETKKEPPFEFLKSSQFVRQLWSDWRTFGREKKYEPGVGVLLSSTLDSSSDLKPKMLLQLYYGQRWNVKWMLI